MDITSKFKEIDKSSTKLQLRVTAKVHNLHGQGKTRQQVITKQSYDAMETEKLDRGIKGSAKHKSSQTAIVKGSKVRERVVEVFTFPTDGDNKLLARLGGSYGYIAGAMKAAIPRRFGDTSKKTNPAYGAKSNLSVGTSIEPEWIEVSDKISNDLEKPLEYLIADKRLFTYYDFIAESDPFTFTITVESELSEEVILHLLAFVQRVGLGPKRRGILEVTKVERTSTAKPS